MQDLLIVLLIGALVIWLGEKVLSVIPISANAKQILGVVLLVLVVVWVVTGGTFFRFGR